MAREGGFVNLRLPSSEVGAVNIDCRATIGVVGNAEHELIRIGKAGASRHRGREAADQGRRDEPGGPPARRRRGQVKVGRHPVTPWGKPTLGYRTRDKKKQSSKYVVRTRRQEQRAGRAREDDLSRSLKKGPYVDEKLLARITDMNRRNEKAVLKTWSRRTHYLPGDGRPHHRRPRRQEARAGYITESMVGHKLGEFAPTRTFRSHGGKLAKEKRARIK